MEKQISDIIEIIDREGRGNALAEKIKTMLLQNQKANHLNPLCDKAMDVWNGMISFSELSSLAGFFAQSLYNLIGIERAMIFISEAYNQNDELIHIARAGHPDLLSYIENLQSTGIMPMAIKIPPIAQAELQSAHLVKFPSLQSLTLGALSDELINEIESKTGEAHYYGYPVCKDEQIFLTISLIFAEPLSDETFGDLERLLTIAKNFFILHIEKDKSSKLNSQLSEIFNQSEFAFAVFESTGRLINANRVFENIFPKGSQAGLYDKEFLQLLQISEEEPLGSQTIMFDLSGKHHTLPDALRAFSIGSLMPVRSSENDISHYIFYLQRTSDERSLREAIWHNEQKYKRIFDHIQDVYFEVKKDGTILELSPSIEKYIGVPRESMIGTNIINLYHKPEQRHEYLNLLDRDGRVDNYHVEFVTPAGEIINTIIVASLVQQGTEFERIVGSMIDVSDHVKHLEMIRESEIKFRSLFDKSPIGIMICDTNGRVIEINNSMLKSLGSPSVEKTKQINVFTFENLVRSGISKAMIDVLRTGETRVFESEYISAWNVKAFFRLFVNIIPDLDGNPEYVMLMAEDISDLREKEIMLRQTEERFLDIYNNTSDLIYTMDFEGNFTSVNPVAEKWLGYRFSDLKNKHMGQFVSHDSAKRAAENIKLKLMGGAPQTTYEVLAFTRKGEKMILEINSFLRYKEGKPIEVFGIARDITERKKHEELIQTALRERESLIMEVHHRVKNNLQLILSMLKMYKQQFSDDRVRQAFRDINQKILAISAVHEDFYFGNNMKDVDFNRYIKTIVSNSIEQYSSECRVEYHIEADEISGSIDMAVPVGLILSELLTNSIRHSSKGKNPVLLSISLKQIDGKKELICSDNGPGIPQSVMNNPEDSMGLELVRLLAEGQLGGEMKLHSGVEGTEVRIVF